MKILYLFTQPLLNLRFQFSLLLNLQMFLKQHLEGKQFLPFLYIVLMDNIR
jgi:hypothetical protein